MSLILMDDSLRDICRKGKFCSATRREFAFAKDDRNLTTDHPYVMFAHCMWCTNVDRGNVIDGIGNCLYHHLKHINDSEPVPPQPTLDPSSVAAATATSTPEKPKEDIAVLAVLLALYSLLICVGLVSNLLVAVILVRNRAMANITNLFVLALSLSDILLCGMLMPALVFHDMTTRNYLTLNLPRTLYCKFFLTSLNVPIYASCLIILWIAVDRYRIICYPHRSRMTQKQARVLLLCTVLLGLLVHSPVIAFNTVDRHRDHGCAERWPDKELRLAYSISAFCLQFCTPLIVTGALYFKIYRRLTERVLRRREVERKRRTNKILISIVISFAFFWSPWSIFNVISEVEHYRKISPEKLAKFFDCVHATKTWDAINANMKVTFDSESESIVQVSWNLYELFVRLFSLGSACVNPYLYGWLNEHVRASLKSCLGRGGSPNSGGGGQSRLQQRRAADDTFHPTTGGCYSIGGDGDGDGNDGGVDEGEGEGEAANHRALSRRRREAAISQANGEEHCELMLTHRPPDEGEGEGEGEGESDKQQETGAGGNSHELEL